MMNQISRRIVYIFSNIHSILSSVVQLVTEVYTLIVLKLVEDIELMDIQSGDANNVA